MSGIQNHGSVGRSCGPVRLEYCDLNTSLLAANSRDVLAIVHFCGHNRRDPADPRRIGVGLPVIAGDKDAEVWLTDEVAASGWEGDIGYALGQDVLFAHLLAPEPAGCGLSTHVYDVYRELLEFAVRKGYPHLLRVWNYIADIHATSESMERYQAFCVGRARAFDAAGVSGRGFPAASAVGSRADGFLVCFLAARSPGHPIENPRQISAYRYPIRYGPRSPSFSRALCKHWPTANALFVSGTASVVGHETRHAGLVEAQLEESLANMDTLVESVTSLRSTAGVAPCPKPKAFKVYVRDPRNLATLEARLRAWAPARSEFLFLGADICRRDLALEFEAVGLSAGHPG